MKIASMVAALLLPAGCVGAGVEAIAPPLPVAAEFETPAAQPRYAYYACDGGRELTVENFQTSVLAVVGARDGIELPARPAGQTRTYGDGRSRLVLEGARAEFSRQGQPTLSCRR
ncbi:MAG: hypothetical protein DI629_17090 [Mesorhizobium amorphae]|nr:MAG: hypothetical protein DI629_17090 [Mesorhizobium amorphae]